MDAQKSKEEAEPIYSAQDRYVDMENIDLDKEATHGFTERTKARMCSVGGVGTGNVLKIENRFLIITCCHVADIYFEQKRPYIILYGNKRIKTEKLQYIARTENKYDIAIIEVVEDCTIQTWYERVDFELIDDFGAYSFEKTNLFVCGFPEHLSYENEKGIFRMWMSYTTLPHDEKKATEDFIFGKYPMDKDNLVTYNGLRTKLPRAPGLSGAFIYKVSQFTGDMDELWTPAHAKVIAIQTSWNTKSWIKGTNIKHMFSLLDKALSTKPY